MQVSGGTEIVSAGGTETNAFLVAGGSQSVDGIAISTTLDDNDVQTVSSGGTASGTVISATDSMVVQSGGSAIDTVISGGTMDVQSGGVASGSIAFSGTGGMLQIDGTDLPVATTPLVAAVVSGFASNDTIDLTGIAYDATGSTTVGAGNVLTISEDGQSYALDLDPAQVFSGATFQLADDGQSGTDITVSLGVAAGGTLAIAAGQYAIGVIVSGGGSLVVSSGGTAVGTQISGGTEIVSAGGTETSAFLVAGGSQSVAGVAVSTTLDDNDVQTVSSGGTASGTVISATDSMVVQSGGTAIDTIISGGTMDVQSGAVTSGAITFSGTGGLLQIDGPDLPTDPAALVAAVVSSFALNDTIDLTGITYDGGGQVNLEAGNLLQINENGSVYDLQLDPSQDFAGDYFDLASDDSGLLGGLGGTDITESNVACYRRGTLIWAADGEVPVEDLKIGDLVVTLSGAAKPIKWIGRRSYAGRFVAGNKDVLPICVKAGALDDGIPARDLWVSPEHALYLDEVLVPARHLVNGSSIVQAEYVESVEYFHIELAAHDVIIAEGAFAESFVDDDSRMMFHNAAEFFALHPEAGRVPGGSSARRASRMGLCWRRCAGGWRRAPGGSMRMALPRRLGAGAISTWCAMIGSKAGRLI